MSRYEGNITLSNVALTISSDVRVTLTLELRDLSLDVPLKIDGQKVVALELQPHSVATVRLPIELPVIHCS